VILRDYQIDAVLRAIRTIEEGRLLVASPTGTGKTYMILALKKAWEHEGLTVGVISPRIEILAGFAEKTGKKVTSPKELQKLDFWTPVRYRNALKRGDVKPYQRLIIDEGHHATASTYQILDAIHMGLPVVGFTASAFRGTPRETAKLLEYWGKPYVALSLKDSVAAGWSAFPEIEVVPILDDDEVSIAANGDFQVTGGKGLDEHQGARLGALADLIEDVWKTDGRPMIVSVPSTDILNSLCTELWTRVLPFHRIAQDTTAKERVIAFAAVKAGTHFLVQIVVVSEGIDIPELRVWIDALPTMSPVRWLQTFGRVTRPGDRPRVIVTNRNVERHAYLLEGILPIAKVAEAQQAFGGASRRSGVRHLGLESLGRFKAIEIPLLSGCIAHGYALYSWDRSTGKKEEYFALALPNRPDLLFARRISQEKGGRMSWGKWTRCASPTDFVGYQSTPKSWSLTEKMEAWWVRAARGHGLRAEPPEQARVFQVLPVLSNLKVKIDEN